MILLIATLFCAYSANGQGVTVGINTSNLYIDHVSDENTKIGLMIGIHGRCEISGSLGVKHELVYTQKGTSAFYENFLQGSGSYRYNLNYIQLPLMLSQKFGPIDLHAGPYGAILLGANVKDVRGDGTVRSLSELDRNDFNTFDYGAAMGIGYQMGGAMVTIRYQYGMRPIGRSGTVAGEAAQSAKNSTLTLSLSFGLN